MSFKTNIECLISERKIDPFFPGDLIQLNKTLQSWCSRTHKLNYDSGEPKRWAETGEIKLILSVEPLITRGSDVPCTTWLLTCLSDHGIEFLRAHKKTMSINYTILSPGISWHSTLST